METAGLDHWADILVIVLYFVIVVSVGLWTVCRPQRGNVKNYFLAGRSMGWLPVGASLFSSNIGSEHFVGLAGAGAAAGIAVILYEWFPVFLILMLGWLFIPVYVSAGVYTLPEYLERRHGGKRIRLYLSCVALALYIVTKLASAMFAGALFIQISMKWDMYLSLGVLIAITGLYTVLGGLTAVMYTDTFQTVVMVLGSFSIMIVGFIRIGGYNNLERLYFASIPSVAGNKTTCGLPHKDAFHIFQDAVTGDQPWPGLVIQSSLGCLWYWCCDQVIVQRSLAARSLTHAKGGSILAGCLKILPLFLLIFPGMISRILFPDAIACSNPEICKVVCDNPVGCSNIAYPKLVLELLPIGAKGLLLAVMLSAIMSSLTSIFNSASTVFTMDLWRRFRPNARQRELLIIGRMFVIIMCFIGILWVPLVKASQSGRLFSYMVAMEGYLGSPIGICFLLSIFWKRTTETGAFVGLICGHLLGLSRLIVELIYPAPPCGEAETRPAFLYKIHFTYFSQITMLMTGVMIVLISLFTTPRSDKELKGVTWWTRLHGTDGLPPSSYTSETTAGVLTDIEKKETDDIDNLEPVVVEHADKKEPKSGRLKSMLDRVCGTSEADAGPGTSNFDVKQIQHFMSQKKSSKTILNLFAIILMCSVAFLTGYYY
ncbi:hypothetical protein ACJMK2_038979 [Sinanodonta woodiana]|uniref:Sodium/glucose cotransporter 4 n=1 Tax=Sinanodonta woodiana TaxID=1069815 RepID=A0ABD3WAM2_SINWO